MTFRCHRLLSATASMIFFSITKHEKNTFSFFVCFGFLTSSSTTRLYCGRAPRHLKTERLATLLTARHETERGDHDFCLSRSHYTDTDPNSRERAATLFVCLFGFLTSSSTTRLYRGRAPRQERLTIFTCCHT